MKVEEFIERLKRRKDIGEFTYLRELPRKGATFSTPDLSEPVKKALASLPASAKIDKLYSHQGRAIELAREGKNVVVMTPTASGKSLCYNIPVIEEVLREPASHALYVFPLKGLEQGQRKALDELTTAVGKHAPFPEPACEIYDGDTTQYRRKKIRLKPPPVILTNPDMLHLGICAYHGSWEGFFENLKYVVIDELHTYRGVLGSHVAQVLRRLRRIAALYGANPVFITCSATISNPVEVAEELTGLPFSLASESGAPLTRRHFVFINPIPMASPYTVATKLFIEAVSNGLKTIAFTKARKVTELMARWVSESSPELEGSISAYRAGYLPEERRDIEARLFSGELSGVISTSALELGVDIGGLDVCILVGYPGTVCSTWQRAGRVGRKGRDALIILVALEDALDQYFMRHPAEFFGAPMEAAVLDTSNRPILKSHLRCAVAEKPVSANEEVYRDTTDITGSNTEAIEGESGIRPLLEEMTDEGIIWHSRVKDTWNTKRRYPHREVSIRGTGDVYRIFLEDAIGGRRLLAETGSSRALKELHPGAVYLHRGSQYLVKGIHLGTREVTCIEASVNYYTSAITEEETEILSIAGTRELGELIVNRGMLRITETVLGFRRKELHTQKVIDEQLLDLPPQIFTTAGVWFKVPEVMIAEVDGAGFGTPGSLHALEHAAIAALPLFALCDRTDLGGVSYTMNPELEAPAVFIHDSHEGGVGLTRRGFEVFPEWTAATLQLMRDCPCEVSCPACTQDPHCGNNNEPLDKRGAIVILKRILGEQ